MAAVQSIASGNFNTTSTWVLIEPINYIDSRATSTTVTTATQSSATASGMSSTISGISLQLAYRAASPTGTFKVELYNTTDSISVALVTINISDLPYTATSAGVIGWTYFKFASNVTLNPLKAYSVRVSTSVATQLNAYALTGTNWSKAFVTTTQQSPVAADTLIITGQYSGIGVGQTNSVVMDNTTSGNTYSYGVCYIASMGVLTYATASSTNYFLKFNNNVYIHKGGTLQIGSSASPFPSSSTASFEIDCNTTASLYSLFVEGGNLMVYGNPKIPYAKLNNDVTIGTTNSKLDTITSWNISDTIVVPSTSTTPSDVEIITLTSVSGFTISHSAYVAAHGGSASSMVQATIGNMTRNIRIYATNPSYPMLLAFQGIDPNATLYYTQLYSLSITINPNTNSTTTYLDLQYNTMQQLSTAVGLNAVAVGIGNGIGSSIGQISVLNFMNNITYNYNYPLFFDGIYSNTNVRSNVTYNLFYKHAGGYYRTSEWKHNFSNNILSSSGQAYNISLTVPVTGGSFGSFDNNIIHSNTGAGAISMIIQTSGNSFTINNMRVWRNGQPGFIINNTTADVSSPTIINNMYSFGNSTDAIGPYAATSPSIGSVIVNNSFFWGGTTNVATYMMNTAGGIFVTGGVYNFKFNNCVFGIDYLGRTSNFSTAVLNILYGTNITFIGCTFSGTEAVLSGRGGLIEGSTGIVSLKHNNITNSYKQWNGVGVIQSDITNYSGVTQSIRMTPSNASYKLNTPLYKVAVDSGNICTVSVNIRKSTLGDGILYNGTQPRLMYHYNALSGNYSETIGTVSTVGAGVWTTLTYTTPTVLNDSVLEFYIDCSGSAGWVNYTNWASSISNLTNTGKYWATGLGAYIEIGNTASTTQRNYISVS